MTPDEFFTFIQQAAGEGNLSAGTNVDLLGVSGSAQVWFGSVWSVQFTPARQPAPGRFVTATCQCKPHDRTGFLVTLGVVLERSQTKVEMS